MLPRHSHFVIFLLCIMQHCLLLLLLSFVQEQRAAFVITANWNSSLPSRHYKYSLGFSNQHAHIHWYENQLVELYACIFVYALCLSLSPLCVSLRIYVNINVGYIAPRVCGQRSSSHELKCIIIRSLIVPEARRYTRTFSIPLLQACLWTRGPYQFIKEHWIFGVARELETKQWGTSKLILKWKTFAKFYILF